MVDFISSNISKIRRNPAPFGSDVGGTGGDNFTVGGGDGNTVFMDALKDVRVSVREGSTLGQPLRDSGVFPPLVTRMIGVGEQTGEMEEMFNKIADIYDLQVETTLSALTSLLEPIMILMIGVVMGFIVFAILLPIFELTSAIG